MVAVHVDGVCACTAVCSFVEVTVLGLRDLAPFAFQSIYMPFVEIDCGDRARSTNVRKTKASKLPSGSNPNFLEVLESLYCV